MFGATSRTIPPPPRSVGVVVPPPLGPADERAGDGVRGREGVHGREEGSVEGLCEGARLVRRGFEARVGGLVSDQCLLSTRTHESKRRKVGDGRGREECRAAHHQRDERAAGTHSTESAVHKAAVTPFIRPTSSIAAGAARAAPTRARESAGGRRRRERGMPLARKRCGTERKRRRGAPARVVTGRRSQLGVPARCARPRPTFIHC